MARDVGEREVVVPERPEQREHRERAGAEDEQQRAFGDPRPFIAVRETRVDAGADAQRAEEEGEAEEDLAPDVGALAGIESAERPPARSLWVPPPMDRETEKAKGTQRGAGRNLVPAPAVAAGDRRVDDVGHVLAKPREGERIEAQSEQVRVRRVRERAAGPFDRFRDEGLLVFDLEVVEEAGEVVLRGRLHPQCILPSIGTSFHVEVGKDLDRVLVAQRLAAGERHDRRHLEHALLTSDHELLPRLVAQRRVARTAAFLVECASKLARRIIEFSCLQKADHE